MPPVSNQSPGPTSGSARDHVDPIGARPRIWAARHRAWYALVALALVGCMTPDEYALEADLQVYAAVRERREELGALDPFTIDAPTASLRQRLLEGEETEPLDLQELLSVAAENSRTYRLQREDLFLTALSLTLEQWDFSVQEIGTLATAMNGSGDDLDTQSASSLLSFSKLFTSGLAVVGSVALDSVRVLGTGGNWDEVGRLSLSLTQPLMRGFGTEIVREPLTQAERNVLYAARDYERFRRTFAFDITSQFFAVLRNADTLRNEIKNFDSVQSLRERNESFAEAGRLRAIEVDQALQDELRARNSVIEAERRLERSVDDFKFQLGLPIEAALPLDPADYLDLATWDFLELDPPEDIVIDQALTSRLDYLTVIEQVEDAERRVNIAADALRAGLDLEADVDAVSEVNEAANFPSDDVAWGMGLSFDAPIDRLPERNAYRSSLITLERARRSAEQAADRIVADLREELRALRVERESFDIQTNAVALAERRVESTELSLEAGRANTRDVLDSQEDLVAARNNATAALIDYILAGLALYRDMELIRVTPEGVQADTAPLLARIEARQSGQPIDDAEAQPGQPPDAPGEDDE